MSALQAGIEIVRKLFGREPDKGSLSPEFFDMTMANVYGQVWTRPRLSMEERSLLTVAVLAAGRVVPELETHLKGARHLGIDRAKAEEVMIHVGHYSGWPCALQGFRSVEKYSALASKREIRRRLDQRISDSAVTTAPQRRLRR